MSNEDIIKFINDNCRHCRSGEVYRDMIDDCHDCPLLKKFLENKGTTILHSDYGDFELKS